MPDFVHYHLVRFQTIYCLEGWVRLVYEGQGEPFLLRAGDLVRRGDACPARQPPM